MAGGSSRRKKKPERQTAKGHCRRQQWGRGPVVTAATDGGRERWGLVGARKENKREGERGGTSSVHHKKHVSNIISTVDIKMSD